MDMLTVDMWQKSNDFITSTVHDFEHDFFLKTRDLT